MRFANAFDDETLPPNHREALKSAIEILTDEFFMDVGDDKKSIDDTNMESFLPPLDSDKYGNLFRKQFLVCLTVVGWKLAQPERRPLASIGEQLALRTIVEEATGLLEERGQEHDFGAFEDAAFEDLDHEFLFDLKFDGLHGSPIGDALGTRNSNFKDWFKPFDESESAHPYLEDEPNIERQ